MSSIADLLQQGTEALKASPSARLDAELLLGYAAGLNRVQLTVESAREVADDVAKRFRDFVKRRAMNEPVAYITGVREFYGLEFTVTPAVLVPRPETELIVSEVVRWSSGRDGILNILDLGTGSGCISIALATEFQKSSRRCKIVGVDSSAEALEVAAANAKRLGVKALTEWVQSDWFTAVPARSYDYIVANPPYIAVGDKHVGPELKHEPQQALYSGKDGLDAIRTILSALPSYLARRGEFFCEIGAQQGSVVADLWSTIHPELANGSTVEILNDLAGRERVLHIGVRP